MTHRILISLIALLSISAHAETDEDIQKRVFNQYLQQAEKGDANAQFITASRYEVGKGTEKSSERAQYWYEMAAKKGHPLAKIKVDERTQAVAGSAAKAIAAAKPAAQMPDAAKANEPARNPETKPVIAKPAANHLNPAQAVLGGKWSREKKPAEFLPSSLATCLSTSPAEVVCFSQELTRNVTNKALTYTVKATLKGMDGHDGRFKLEYLYNVIDVDGKPSAKTSSTQADFGDLAAREGWQEPGQKLDCRLRDEHTMNCMRPDQKTNYTFTRE